MPSLAQLIVWIVVGLIGGGLASRMITWQPPFVSRESPSSNWSRCGIFDSIVLESGDSLGVGISVVQRVLAAS